MIDPRTGSHGYYVYEILVDGAVRYVGKGRGRRAKRHAGIALAAVTRHDKHRYARLRFYKLLGAAIIAGACVEVRYVAVDLSSERAFRKEVDLIAAYGLANLWNSTSGGEGISAEAARDIATKRWSDEAARKRQSERLREAYSDPAVRHRHKASVSRELSQAERAVRASNANKRWARPGERDRQATISRATQAQRAAKRHANIFCGALAFGC